MKRWTKTLSGLMAVAMTAGLIAPPAQATETQDQISGLENYLAPVKTSVFAPIAEHAHGSSIVVLPNGELLSVWFQADGERKANDGRIMASRKLPGGDWMAPFVIADTPNMADINPTVYVDEGERLWLFWYPVLANQWESSQPKYMYAERGHYEYSTGHTTQPDWDWQEIMYPVPGDDFVGQATSVDGDGVAHYRPKGDTIKHLSAEQFSRWEYRDDPSKYVQLDDKYITDTFVTDLYNGYMDAATYFADNAPYDPATNQAVVELATQYATLTAQIAAGATNTWKKWNPSFRRIGWQTKNKPMEIQWEGGTRLLLPLYADQFAASIMAYSDDDGASWQYSSVIAALGDIQAATVQKQDGTLRSYFRNAAPGGYLIYHESTDGGATWGPMGLETQLSHVGGFDMLSLDDGTWVMAITETIADATDKSDNRARLNLAVSKDEGETWTVTPLEEDMTGLSSFHYPAIMLGQDETIYVSYSHDLPDNTNTIGVATLSLPTPPASDDSSSDTAGTSGNVSGNDTKAIVDAITKGSGDVTVTLKDGATTLDRSVFQALADSGKTMTVRGTGFTWTIQGKDLTETNAATLDLGVSLATDTKDWAMSSDVDRTQVALGLDLAHQGAFPGPMTLTVQLPAQYAGKTLQLYWLDDGTPELIASATAGSGAQISFRLDHASRYIVTTQSLVIFGDITDHWAESAILSLSQRGIVGGIAPGVFAPNKTLTRAEFVTMLAKLSGEALPTVADAPFSDVAKDDWYAPYVLWATNAGITTGVGQDRFAPQDQITREQICVMLAHFVRATGKTLSSTVPAASFADGASISAYATDAVSTMQQAGIVTGRGEGRFVPQGPATRAECAQILINYLKNVEG